MSSLRLRIPQWVSAWASKQMQSNRGVEMLTELGFFLYLSKVSGIQKAKKKKKLAAEVTFIGSHNYQVKGCGKQMAKLQITKAKISNLSSLFPYPLQVISRQGLHTKYREKPYVTKCSLNIYGRSLQCQRFCKCTWGKAVHLSFPHRKVFKTEHFQREKSTFPVMWRSPFLSY